MPVVTSLAAYESCLNEQFAVLRDGAPKVSLTLVRAECRLDTPAQQCFSLLFDGPDGLLPQQNYRLAHERLNELDLFLVPVARTAAGYQYQSVFNLLKDPQTK